MRRDNLTKRTLTLAAALLSVVILAGCSKVNNAAATVPGTSVSETSGEGIVSTEETTAAEKSTKADKDSTSSVENETTTIENTTAETTTSGSDGTGSGTEEKTSGETEATVKTPSETTTEARTEKQTETTTQATTEKVTEEPTETPTEKQTEKQTEPETTTQAKHEHNYTSKVTKEPSCTAEGVRTYSCSCGNSYTESISANGHSFGSYTYNNDATYDADGTETATCSVCGAKDTRTASGTKLVHAHNYAPAVTKEPTCTEEGVRTYTCSCGNSYTEGIPAKGHSYGEYVYNNDATTSADGTKTATCSACGATDTVTAEGTKKALPSWYDEHPDKPLNVATGFQDDGSLEMYFTDGDWTGAANGCWDFGYNMTADTIGEYAEG